MPLAQYRSHRSSTLAYLGGPQIQLRFIPTYRFPTWRCVVPQLGLPVESPSCRKNDAQAQPQRIQCQRTAARLVEEAQGLRLPLEHSAQPSSVTLPPTISWRWRTTAISTTACRHVRGVSSRSGLIALIGAVQPRVDVRLTQLVVVG